MSENADLETYGTWDRMTSGAWHLPSMSSADTAEEHQRTMALVKHLNDLGNTDTNTAENLISRLLGIGSAIPQIHVPLNVEYGTNITFGEHSFVNFGATFLAQAPINFGDHTQIGPNCSFITINHPVNDHAMRRGGWEKAAAISVGDNCWFGANVTVLPGVSIGDNCVFAANSVINRDVPDNSLMAGVPAVCVRELNDAQPLEREELDGPVDGMNR